MFIRLFLIPDSSNPSIQQIQIIDVNEDVLILSNGEFVSPMVATSVTLVGVPFEVQFIPFNSTQASIQLQNNSTKEVKICKRISVNSDDYPDPNVIEVNDPTGGICICGITCLGSQITYVKVYQITT
jgi:hypothetical protein